MFREMVRKNQQLSMEECIGILTKETRGVLSVLGDEGYPYGTPMNHFYNADDGCIYFHSGNIGHRLEALRNYDKVSFCVVEPGEKSDGEWFYRTRSVIVFGKIDIIDDQKTIVDLTTRLSYKFTQDEDYIQQEIKGSLHRTLLLRLKVEHICGKRIAER